MKFLAESSHLPQTAFVGKHRSINSKIYRLILLEESLATLLRSQPIENPFKVIGFIGDHDVESLSCWFGKIALMQLAGKALVDSSFEDLGKRQNLLHSYRRASMISIKRLVTPKNTDRGQP